DQLLLRNDAADQTGALSLLCIHHACRQAHFHGFRFADKAGEPLRAASPRQRAKIDFGLAELRVVSSEDEVAHHRKLAAAAECEAGYRRDHWLATGGGALPVRGD